jgi:TrmH family RNA methyltransferase
MPGKRAIRIVLVRPRNPLNIGAVARAMGNFGLSDLVVLDPYEPVWQETRSAPGAEQIIQEARLVATWEAAVEDVSVVLGTSSFHQRPFDQAVIELPNLHAYLAPLPASEPAAIVFGSERSGLSNEELARCRAVLHIPTQKQVPSMNLAQAVAVVLYELRREGWETLKAPLPAPAQELEAFIESLGLLGQSVDYPAGYEQALRIGRIRQALQSSVLHASTVRFLLSFSRWLLKKRRETSRP